MCKRFEQAFYKEGLQRINKHVKCKFKSNGYRECDKIPNAAKDIALKCSHTADAVQLATTALENFFILICIF